MIFDSDPLIAMPPTEKLSVILTFELMTFMTLSSVSCVSSRLLLLKTAFDIRTCLQV